MLLVLIIAPEIADSNGPAPPPPAAQRSVMDRPELSSADPGLTPRQLDVLALMRQGKSNKAICRALDLAEPTVKNHVTAILKAFKVTNRTQAVIAASTLAWHSSSEGRAEPYPGLTDRSVVEAVIALTDTPARERPNPEAYVHLSAAIVGWLKPAVRPSAGP